MYKGIYRIISVLSIVSGLVIAMPLHADNVQQGYDPQFAGINEYLAPSGSWAVTSARSALLFDADTGTVLYAKSDQSAIPPASMTKLFTMAIVFKYLQKNALSLDQPIRIDAAAWASAAPPRSSLMFLGQGQRCSWNDLLYGLAVSSGNDAAIAAALNVAGSVEAFVADMNALARSLGMHRTIFVEPSGYDAGNRTTARDYAYFVWWYLKQYPQALRYHSAREFTYPRPENLPPGADPVLGSITQKNKNALLVTYAGADGLKTGYIDESGYNMAFTATRADFRLAGVIFGSGSEPGRTADATSLLDEGFSRFVPVWLDAGDAGSVRIFKGEKAMVSLGRQRFKTSLPRDLLAIVQPTITLDPEYMAPLSRGERLGTVAFKSGNTLLFNADIVAPESIALGPGLYQLMDELYLGIRSWFGEARPAQRDQ